MSSVLNLGFPSDLIICVTVMTSDVAEAVSNDINKKLFLPWKH